MDEHPVIDADSDILDIYLPQAEPDHWLISSAITLALLVAFAVAWLLIHFIREDRRRKKRNSGPRSIALAQLARVESEAGTMRPNLFALKISDIVKDYLHHRHGDRYRFETAEEFLRRAPGTPHTATLPPATLQALRDFVSACEELKFGCPGDAAERSASLPDLARLILRPHPPTPPAAAPPTGSHNPPTSDIHAPATG